MSEKLNTGDRLPALRLTTTAGDIALPDDLASEYTYLVFYRGHW